MKILVTGGTGYIGSHTAVELLGRGHKVVIADNLSNSSAEVVKRIETLGGRVEFYKADMLDIAALEKIFDEHNFDCVMHFAGLKAVGESLKDPMKYYLNNVAGTLNLLGVMLRHGVKSIIFSSSATVYGAPETVPLTEQCRTGQCSSPYGRTKLMVEKVLADMPDMNVIILRYFNPIGAHESGLIGESPNGTPNNLMPYITQVAGGKLPYLGIFGADYETRDGTCIRDYLHVVDLADAHVMALDKIGQSGAPQIFNLGTGNGVSVLELMRSFERVNGVEIPYRILPRRSGDVPVLFCDPSKAKRELGWVAKRNIDDMCRDSRNFQMKNPNGIAKFPTPL